MASLCKIFVVHKFLKFRPFFAYNSLKLYSTEQPEKEPEVEHVYHSRKNDYVDPVKPEDRQLLKYRHAFPEFLPDSNMHRRHKIREKIERLDMLKRRTVIHIPEFYVGSILAVTVSDPFAPGKVSRFVGICILRDGQGLRATFTLRNHVHGQGTEILYDLYNPTIRKIEVLKLEKRLDDQLLYLRDAAPEYSTIPFDMLAEPHNPVNPVPINPIKVPLKPAPWYCKWHRRDIKGVSDMPGLDEESWQKAKKFEEWWTKYDLMKEYRLTIPEEEQVPIFKDVHKHCLEVEEKRKIERRKSILQKSQD